MSHTLHKELFLLPSRENWKNLSDKTKDSKKRYLRDLDTSSPPTPTLMIIQFKSTSGTTTIDPVGRKDLCASYLQEIWIITSFSLPILQFRNVQSLDKNIRTDSAKVFKSYWYIPRRKVSEIPMEQPNKRYQQKQHSQLGVKMHLHLADSAKLTVCWSADPVVPGLQTANMKLLSKSPLKSNVQIGIADLQSAKRRHALKLPY